MIEQERNRRETSTGVDKMSHAGKEAAASRVLQVLSPTGTARKSLLFVNEKADFKKRGVSPGLEGVIGLMKNA